MKHLTWLALAFFLIPIALLAQAVPEVITAPVVSDGDFFKLLLGSINGMKGASAMAIAAIVTQIIVALMKTPMFGSYFGKIMGKWQLLIVSGLSLGSGMLALHVAGLDWISTITHSFTLTAMQVFGHQIVSQVSEKKDDAPAAS